MTFSLNHSIVFYLVFFYKVKSLLNLLFLSPLISSKAFGTDETVVIFTDAEATARKGLGRHLQRDTLWGSMI